MHFNSCRSWALNPQHRCACFFTSLLSAHWGYILGVSQYGDIKNHGVNSTHRYVLLNPEIKKVKEDKRRTRKRGVSHTVRDESFLPELTGRNWSHSTKWSSESNTSDLSGLSQEFLLPPFYRKQNWHFFLTAAGSLCQRWAITKLTSPRKYTPQNLTTDQFNIYTKKRGGTISNRKRTSPYKTIINQFRTIPGNFLWLPSAKRTSINHVDNKGNIYFQDK